MDCVKKGGKGICLPMGCVKKGGKGISHPRGEEGWERELVPMGCVKKGGKGISCPWGVRGGKGSSRPRRVGKGFPTHGGCQVKKKAPTVVERLGLFLG